MESKSNTPISSFLANLQLEEKGNVFIVRMDKDFTILTVNDNFVHLLGYQDKAELLDVLHGKMKNAVYQQDFHQVKADLSDIKEEGQTYKISYRLLKKDGSYLWAMELGKVIAAEDGTLALYCFCSDITDFVQRYAYFEKQGELHSGIINKVPGGYYRCVNDWSKGMPFVYIGDVFLSILGWTREEIAEKFANKLVNMIHPQDYAQISTYNENITSLGSNHNLASTTYRILSKNGYVWISDSNSVNDTPEGTFWQGFINDVSDNKTEENLIRALSLSYDSVYACKFSTGYMVKCWLTENITKNYGNIFNEGNYEPMLGEYREKVVAEPDRHLFTEIGTIDKLKQVLGDKLAYSFNFRVARGKEYFYFRCRIARPTIDSDDFCVGFQSIDETVKAEQRHVKLQNQQMRIIEALSYKYSSLFIINVVDETISLYRTNTFGVEKHMVEKLMDIRDYRSAMSSYINNYIVPEDRDRVTEAVTLSNLFKKVPEIGVYTFDFQRLLVGRYSYSAISIAKTFDDNGNIIFIMGLQDVSNQVREQLHEARITKEKNEIIEGLSSEYYSVLLVNTLQDDVSVYRESFSLGDNITNYIHRYSSWTKSLNMYIDDVATDNTREIIREKLSLEYLRQHAENFSFIYEKKLPDRITYLQVRVVFIKGNKDVAVIGTRNVDEIIRKERQQETALREAYQAAEAANNAKTDFLSNMSHDIRTPMNGIIGMTAIAGAHIDEPERVKECLQKITHASKHLLSLINEVLDMSKIESGKIDLMEEEFNLSDFIDNLLDMMNSQIQEHNHKLTVDISHVNHEDVIGDSLRIQKVFTNFMGNAIKYTPDGGDIRLYISEKPCHQPKLGCYEFIFEDNGIGMSEDFVAHIFEPFARAKDQKINHIQGTGLGMPIAQNIVRMMGGDIKIDSKLGEGSKFTVTIFLKLQEDMVEDYTKFINLPVLVADDDPLSLESCCSILDDLGMETDGVADGFAAYEKVVEHHQDNKPYYACILDWKMPGMNGVELIRNIRQQVGPEVPVIIISAYDWTEIEQEARAAGANAFISKPLFRSKLVRAFSGILETEQKQHKAPLEDWKKLDLRGHRILLVEDNELNADIAMELLSMCGLEVEYAENGVKAVDMVMHKPEDYYELILMDIQMPVMNGYDATRAIRAGNSSYHKRVPIIALTANAFAEDVQAAKTVGMNEHIAKPLDLQVLERILQKWLH